MDLSFAQPFRTKLQSLKLDGRLIFDHSVRLSIQHFSSRDIGDYGYRFVLQFFKGKVLYICQTAAGLTKPLLLSLVPEFINPVFGKTSPKRSFSLIENERFGFFFPKTGSINLGIGKIDEKAHLEYV
jgi:hypothetical protein